MSRVDKKGRPEDSFGDQAVVIALGSNLAGAFGTTRELLEAALGRIAGREINILARSRWWRSAAWPDATQPDYLNGIAIVETHLPPRALMALLLEVEREFGRERADPNAARTLDLDLIAYDRQVVSEPGLTLPHPRAADRRFVMGPLAELSPYWTHPVSGQSAAILTQSTAIGADATPVDASPG